MKTATVFLLLCASLAAQNFRKNANGGISRTKISYLANHHAFPGDRLVALYDFTDGSGTTVSDLSANGLNGSTYNNPAWMAGGGLTLSGSQWVTLPPDSRLNFDNMPFSVSARFKFSITGGVIVSRGGGSNSPSGGWLATTSFQTKRADGSGSFVQNNTTPMQAGTVYRITYNLSYSTVSLTNSAALYTNGVAANGTTTPAVVAAASSATWTPVIGARTSGSPASQSTAFAGTLYRVALYSRFLTKAEIWTLDRVM